MKVLKKKTVDRVGNRDRIEATLDFARRYNCFSSVIPQQICQKPKDIYCKMLKSKLVELF